MRVSHQVLLHIVGNKGPDGFRKLKELGIAGKGVGPQDAFYVNDISAVTEFFRSVRQVVLFKRNGDTRVACGFVVSLHCSEEYCERPAH